MGAWKLVELFQEDNEHINIQDPHVVTQEVSDESQIFAAVWFAVFGLVDLVVWVWFWRNRDEEPIKSKNPRIIAFQNTVIFIWTLMTCLPLLRQCEFSCIFKIWILITPLVIVYALVILRGLFLYFQFVRMDRLVRYLPKLEQIEIDSEESSLSDTPLQDNKDSERFLDNVTILDPRHISAILFGFSFIMLFPLIILSVQNKQENAVDGGHCEFIGWIEPMFSAYLGICAFLLFIIALLLRPFGKEHTRTKRELQWLSFVTVVAAVPYWIIHDVYHETEDSVFPFSLLILLILMQVFYLGPTLPPLLRIRRTMKQNQMDQRKTKSQAELVSFRKVIENEHGFAAFKAYLQTEFAVENLMFHSEVVRYRTNISACGAWRYAYPEKNIELAGIDDQDDDDDGGVEFTVKSFKRLQRKAKHIYFVYFSSRSLSELNIPSVILNEIIEVLNVPLVQNETEFHSLGPLARNHKRSTIQRKKRSVKMITKRASNRGDPQLFNKRESRTLTHTSNTHESDPSRHEHKLGDLDEESPSIPDQGGRLRSSAPVPTTIFTSLTDMNVAQKDIDITELQKVICVFDAAYKHVMKNLQYDNYTRFKKSEFYHNMMTKHCKEFGVSNPRRGIMRRVMTGSLGGGLDRDSPKPKPQLRAV